MEISGTSVFSMHHVKKQRKTNLAAHVPLCMRISIFRGSTFQGSNRSRLCPDNHGSGPHRQVIGAHTVVHARSIASARGFI